MRVKLGEGQRRCGWAIGGERRARLEAREDRILGLFRNTRDGVGDGLLALCGHCFRERSLMVDLSGPFEDIDGKCLMLTRRAGERLPNRLTRSLLIGLMRSRNDGGEDRKGM